MLEQIDNLCHELAHAYQHQILGQNGRLRHDKTGGEINRMFLGEIDKMLKIITPKQSKSTPKF